jgi:N-carbamoylputrescine amidase
MVFTVACAQIAPDKGKVEKNLNKIGAAIKEASDQGADLVLLPEASTSGYFLEGGVLESSLTARNLLLELTKRVTPVKKQVDVLVGFYERLQGELYNSAAYLTFGPDGNRTLAVYRKFFLPTYGVFDEDRFVSRGRDLGVVDTRFGRIGLLLCEDVWHSILPMLLAMHGVQMILIPSASPGRGFNGETVENLDRYRRLMRGVSEEHGVWCLNCQLCGFEGGKGFVGGSMIFDPMGRLVGQSPILEEHLLLAEVDLELVTVARSQSPLISDLRSAWGDIRRFVNDME